MGLVPLKGKLKLLRHLFQRDDEGQLSLRFGYKLHELKSLIRNQSSEESPLRSLLKCTDLEQFKNTLDDVIRERCGLKKLGRLFGEAQRTCEQGSASESASCHFGKLPLELIHRTVCLSLLVFLKMRSMRSLKPIWVSLWLNQKKLLVLLEQLLVFYAEAVALSCS